MAPPEALAQALNQLGGIGIGIDPDGAPEWVDKRLREKGEGFPRPPNVPAAEGDKDRLRAGRHPRGSRS